MTEKKILIIRFSSFGDIIQCMGAAASFKNRYSGCEMHWVTRKDFGELIEVNEDIIRVWKFNKNDGLLGLIKLGVLLRREKFDYIYDAHSNIRSRILSTIIVLFRIKTNFIRRSKDRLKRIFLFNFRINKFPKPFKGMRSYQYPLARWGVVDYKHIFRAWVFPNHVKDSVRKEISSFLIKDEKFIALIPSAAWEMKRWPVDHWHSLVKLLEGKKCIILGGPKDTFCEQIAITGGDSVLNLSGKLSLIESSYVVSESKVFITGDTGLLHVGDYLGKQGIALIGPTAFGFPSGNTIKVLEKDLYCRPCTKDGSGKCFNKEYKLCMNSISPEYVAEQVKEIWKENE